MFYLLACDCFFLYSSQLDLFWGWTLSWTGCTGRQCEELATDMDQGGWGAAASTELPGSLLPPWKLWPCHQQLAGMSPRRGPREGWALLAGSWWQSTVLPPLGLWTQAESRDGVASQ